MIIKIVIMPLDLHYLKNMIHKVYSKKIDINITCSEL